ncbi:Ribosomal RNA small subunit methyltransferase J [invertebrate metagenome]|uniref:Ribosomal RNA small subunit methyltransferase J n=1 Tax=invertebrate metagenome TaxID=1711999 RepID=A0A2H9TC21_9ZZZZ
MSANPYPSQTIKRPETFPVFIKHSSALQQRSLLQQLTDTYHYPSISCTDKLPDNSFILEVIDNRLVLNRHHSQESPLSVDFVEGKAAHRRLYGGGKGQDIAKAVGLNKASHLSILDATGGLGRDAFVLASLGCKITLLERSPIIATLLKDGIDRALSADDKAIHSIVQRMTTININAISHMISLSDQEKKVDVVYLDPMFPDRKKSALVKKEMRLFHDLLGNDHDSDTLLKPALTIARHRVVVKRPRQAPFLDNASPTYTLKGKSCRYDIHVLNSYHGI